MRRNDLLEAEKPTESIGPFLGCAGWSLPSTVQEHFPKQGTHLERYAAVFPAVEINTSFYRPHRSATYARWRDSVPDQFRFAVKIPKEITHQQRLLHAGQALEKFISEVSHLEQTLGCLLLQLPPRLQYSVSVAEQFFHVLRKLTPVALACEPRHPTWFSPAAADMLASFDVAYVAADPPVAPLPDRAAVAPMAYLRLHGSPQVYHSAYSDKYLDQLGSNIKHRMQAGQCVWCIFDNTADGAAVPNALSLLARW